MKGPSPCAWTVLFYYAAQAGHGCRRLLPEGPEALPPPERLPLLRQGGFHVDHDSLELWDLLPQMLLYPLAELVGLFH